MKNELTIAPCQFPVSGDIKRNASYILRQMAEAKEKGADVSHFPESSLSGYAGTDFKRYKRQDEALRLGFLEKIIQLSSELKIWVIVGSHHFDKNNHLKGFYTAASCDLSISIFTILHINVSKSGCYLAFCCDILNFDSVKFQPN